MTVTGTNYELKTGNIQVVKVENLQDTKDWLESVLSPFFTVVLNEGRGANIYFYEVIDGQQRGYVVYEGNYLAVDEDSRVFKVDLDLLNMFFKPAV